MQRGFPTGLLTCLRCPADGGILALVRASDSDQWVSEGRVACRSCGRNWHISGGILILLADDQLDAESLHEQAIRDRIAARPIDEGPSSEWSPGEPMDVAPTLRRLAAGADDTVLEMGCGDGRYTEPLSHRAGGVVAVDFSVRALRAAASRLPKNAPVALVQADVSRLKTSPQVFDLALSTLVSNLPTGDQRAAMYMLAARALAPGGRFVFSTHYFGLRARIEGVERVGRYDEGGIYRRYFTAAEIRNETAAVFRDVRTVPIDIVFPFGRRLGLPPLATSDFLMRVPLLRQFGQLLLVEAGAPRAGVLRPQPGPGEVKADARRPRTTV